MIRLSVHVYMGRVTKSPRVLMRTRSSAHFYYWRSRSGRRRCRVWMGLGFYGTTCTSSRCSFIQYLASFRPPKSLSITGSQSTWPWWGCRMLDWSQSLLWDRRGEHHQHWGLRTNDPTLQVHSHDRCSRNSSRLSWWCLEDNVLSAQQQNRLSSPWFTNLRCFNFDRENKNI